MERHSDIYPGFIDILVIVVIIQSYQKLNYKYQNFIFLISLIQFMTSIIPLLTSPKYVQFPITKIRITDIIKSKFWYLQIELMISLLTVFDVSNSKFWYYFELT